jgi:hypothetical protein
MKKIIGAVAGLALSTTAAFANEAVDINKIDNTLGSATNCFMYSTNVLKKSTADITVNSIRTCFQLGSSYSMHKITALREGEIVADYTQRRNTGYKARPRLYYIDTTPN